MQDDKLKYYSVSSLNASLKFGYNRTESHAMLLVTLSISSHSQIVKRLPAQSDLSAFYMNTVKRSNLSVSALFQNLLILSHLGHRSERLNQLPPSPMAFCLPFKLVELEVGVLNPQPPFIFVFVLLIDSGEGYRTILALFIYFC